MREPLLYVSKNIINFGHVWSEEMIGEDYIVFTPSWSFMNPYPYTDADSDDNEKTPLSGYLVMFGHSDKPNAHMDELTYEVVDIYTSKDSAIHTAQKITELNKWTEKDFATKASKPGVSEKFKKTIFEAKTLRVFRKLVLVDDENNIVIT